MLPSSCRESSSRPTVDLATYRNPPDLDKGASFAKRAVWHVVNALVLQNPLSVSKRVKVFTLRAFGAKVGKGVVLKTGISVKSPWNLEIGDNTWIGERSWIDSLAPVKIGSNVCLSQDTYLCCGNHDWSDTAFGKTVKPIVVEDGAWIASRAVVMGGVTIGNHAVVAACSLLSRNAEPYTIYGGTPAVALKQRVVRANENLQIEDGLTVPEISPVLLRHGLKTMPFGTAVVRMETEPRASLVTEDR